MDCAEIAQYAVTKMNSWFPMRATDKSRGVTFPKVSLIGVSRPVAGLIRDRPPRDPKTTMTPEGKAPMAIGPCCTYGRCAICPICAHALMTTHATKMAGILRNNNFVKL